MTSPRVYRAAFSVEEAIDTIQESAGTKFDPEVVEIFKRVTSELIDIKAQLPDKADERIRVFVIDHHAVFVEGLIRILGMHEDVSPVGTSSALGEAREKLQSARPSVILLGSSLPDGEGLELLPWLLAELPQARVIMLTESTESAVQLRIIESGCAGFVDKSHGGDEIISAIRTIHAGEPWLSPDLVRSLLSEKPPTRAKSRHDLSERELQVLQLTAEGFSSTQIAKQLVLSQHTIRNHIQRIISKLGAHSRLQAVAKAAERGLIILGPGGAAR